MQKHPELTRQRLEAFLSERGLRGRIYPRRFPVELSTYTAPGRITFAEAMRGQYRPIRVGKKFEPLWSTHWVKVEIEIPSEWKGQEVHLLWDSCSEACVWQDGQPTQGLTGSSRGWGNNALRPDYCLTRAAQGGDEILVYIEVACNGLFGIEGDAQINDIGLLRQAEIAVFDREAWDLLWDLQIIADMAQHLPNTPRGGQALFAANEMVNTINLDDRTTWPTAREIAAKFLAARNGDGQFNLSAVGHAHIDTAWLWPLAETRRKCIRSFSSAVRYMQDYPDYRFACSQAQQYEWIKQTQPELYEKIKARVKEGRFIPTGGSWVEPDCNIPSGESLVRQFLYGQRFFRQEFGVTCIEFWEPDVFGYPAALPQILRGVGMTRFLTIKLSWSQFNKIGRNTFLWEGLDGSRVLTHFPPLDDYNSRADVKDALKSASNFSDLERAREGYLLFGWGDGGGGPTPAMLEQLKRMGDVDGLPRVAMRSPHEFFDRCEADIQDPLVWVGELYLELHRGTYTTQARNKLLNRRSELLLRDVEFLSALAHALRGLAYPHEELDRIWKLVLTNQFHDILPGSSIAQVYQDSTADYFDVLQTGERLREAALQALAEPEPGVRRLCVVNTLSAPRRQVAELPEGMPSGQTAANGKPLGIVSAPAMGYAIAVPVTQLAAPVRLTESADHVTLENEFVCATFKRDGHLASLFDKCAQRECVAPGAVANHFVLFDDHPAQWEAWDVDIFHLEKRYEISGARSAHVTEAGPLRAAVEFDYALSPASTLKQTVSLTALSPRLDFETEVEWRESHKFLKVEFPLDIRAQNATYEIQFGHLQRPTHFNTSWDMARFEVCSHKWADLAEPDYGVALLNDCKYGYSTQGNVMRLSLLRSPQSPDPTADMGHHTFSYALLPHAGTLQQAEVVQEGYRFNTPLLLRATNAPPGEVSFFNVSLPSVVIDTVKQAEDSHAIIVRLYEAHGTHGAARLSSALPVQSATRCNLLEEEDSPLDWAEGGVTLKFTPFQIITVKLVLRTERA